MDLSNYQGKTLTFKCRICGNIHEVPLDASGHYEGGLPCSPHDTHRVQVDPQVWRAAIEEERSRTVN